MLSIRRKGRSRFGPRRILVRLSFRVIRRFAPGLLASAAASYFMDSNAGGARRQKALDLVSGKKG